MYYDKYILFTTMILLPLLVQRCNGITAGLCYLEVSLNCSRNSSFIYIKKYWLLERGWKEDLEMHELELRRLQEDSNKRFGELKRAYEQAERRAPLLSVR
jgi:hypothetical protein